MKFTITDPNDEMVEFSIQWNNVDCYNEGDVVRLQISDSIDTVTNWVTFDDLRELLSFLTHNIPETK